MDDPVIEMLSRYVDGDLNPEEEQKLLARMQADTELRSKLERLQELRSSLALLAESEKVPADLDALIEPLRRGRPEAVSARPWARWLATAAAAVLGLSVIIEVNQRNSRPPSPEASKSRPGRAVGTTERFSLAPLPTSSVPPEEQLLGVSERLLASPIPEMEIEESPPLQVLGPLNEPPGAEEDIALGDSVGTDSPAETAGSVPDFSAPSPRSAAHRESRGPDGAFTDDAPAQSLEAEPGGEKGLRNSAARRPVTGESPAGRAHFYVFVGEKTAWQVFVPRSRCEPGRYTVRVRVGNGVVRDVWPVGSATSGLPSGPLCASELVHGLAVAETADGEYAAEVVVEPGGAKHD